MERVCLLTAYNLYETKRAFTASLGHALERAGVDVTIIDLGEEALSERHVEQILSSRPDLTCSFNSIPPLKEGAFLWDFLKIPHLSMLLDPAIYSMDLVQSPYSIVSCVDHFDCELFRHSGFEHVFFLGHAVPHALFEEEIPEKTYDAVFIGSGYDPQLCLKRWEQNYAPHVQSALKQASEITVGDAETSFTQALVNACRDHKVQDANLVELSREVDTYTRALGRLELLRALDDVDIHVFGGIGWQDDEGGARSWQDLLEGCSHVTVHDPVPFSEALNLLRHSKVCLNSMPFFKQGSHERVLLALACGCLSVTSANRFWDAHFGEDSGVFQYLHGEWQPLKNWIKHLLKHNDERNHLVERGRKITVLEHTWRVRAQDIVENVSPILEAISSENFVRQF